MFRCISPETTYEEKPKKRFGDRRQTKRAVSLMKLYTLVLPSVGILVRTYE